MLFQQIRIVAKMLLYIDWIIIDGRQFSYRPFGSFHFWNPFWKLSYSTGGSRISQGGRQPRRVVRQPIIWQNLLKTAWKCKKLDQKGGGAHFYRPIHHRIVLNYGVEVFNSIYYLKLTLWRIRETFYFFFFFILLLLLALIWHLLVRLRLHIIFMLYWF